MKHPAENIEVMLSAEKISNRIAELGSQITADYQDIEKPLIAVCILKGAVIFFADLVRQLDVPVEMGFKGISSYGHAQTSSGTITKTVDLAMDVANRDVLIVEDLVDTGLSAQYLMEMIGKRGPKSVKFCSLLEKSEKNESGFRPDYLGFDIPDVFVIGYGLDHAGIYRNLPYVGRVI